MVFVKERYEKGTNPVRIGSFWGCGFVLYCIWGVVFVESASGVECWVVRKKIDKIGLTLIEI